VRSVTKLFALNFRLILSVYLYLKAGFSITGVFILAKIILRRLRVNLVCGSIAFLMWCNFICSFASLLYGGGVKVYDNSTDKKN
jgi:hypothetical protein